MEKLLRVVWFTDFVIPVTTIKWYNRQLSQNNSATDSGSNFLATLYAQSDVFVTVINSDECIETGTLTDTSLFLDGHDLQYFIAKRAAQEEINDLNSSMRNK